MHYLRYTSQKNSEIHKISVFCTGEAVSRSTVGSPEAPMGMTGSYPQLVCVSISTLTYDSIGL